MEIWHNPRCSKSRQTLALIEGAGATPTIRRYLDDPPTAAELVKVLGALGLKPWELVRTGESVYEDLGLRDWAHDDPEPWVAVMVANPSLIERPVVIAADGRAVVGRPPERVHDLL